MKRDAEFLAKEYLKIEQDILDHKDMFDPRWWDDVIKRRTEIFEELKNRILSNIANQTIDSWRREKK